MLIYVNGDSFTTGHELGDEVVPGWPGWVTYYETKTTRNTWFSPRHYQQRLRECTEAQMAVRSQLEKERCWPTLLGNHLGAEVVNGATIGSSMGAIAFRTIIQLQNLIDQGKTIDRVFIMLTDLERMVIYSSKGHNEYEAAESLMAAHAEGEWPNVLNTPLIKAWFNREDIGGFLMRYLTDITTIVSFVKSNLGYYPTLFTTFNFGMTHEVIATVKDNPVISTLMKTSRFDQITEELQLMHYGNNELSCPGGHVGPGTHKNFAKAIADMIKEGKL